MKQQVSSLEHGVESSRATEWVSSDGGRNMAVKPDHEFGQVSEDAKVAAISSLLLGVLVRDWLTSQETAFLDMLSPPGQQFFLVRQDRFLLPQGKPLFPVNLIKRSSLQVGDAIFSFRYESDSGRDADNYNIQSAAIRKGPPDHEFTIGLYGPADPVMRDMVDDSFPRLVRLFRDAAVAAGETYLSLQGRLDDQDAFLLINRASGYVIDAGIAAGAILSADVRELIGQEYGQITDRLASLSDQPRMMLENFTAGDMSLSLIKLTPEADASAAVPVSESDLGLQRLRNSLATMITAASAIESSSQTLSSDETREMAGVILAEAYDIERYLNIELLLREYDQRVTHRVNLQYEAEKAISRFAAGHQTGAEVELVVASAFPYVTAPGNAYSFLLESILANQARFGVNTGPTRMSISSAKNTANLVAIVTTGIDNPSPSSDSDNGHQPELQQLAKRLGAGIRTRIDAEHNTIETSIEIRSGGTDIR